jgi:hypothetical protein
MSDSPSTFHGEPAEHSGVAWGDAAELHQSEDGGGLFHRFKTLRRGTLAELIAFVLTLPEDEQGNYAIQKAGDHRLKIGEIRSLARRPDYPGRD